MAALSSSEFTGQIVCSRLLAVLVIPDPQQALPLVSTLVESGVSAVEVAWRTSHFLSMLKEIRREFPQLLLGVGTILRPDQVDAAREAGADFGLSPGISGKVVAHAAAVNWPFIPGVMTPSDIQLALEHDHRLMKFFPAETSGGLTHLQSINAPFRHLSPRYVVLGGIGENNLRAYANDPSVAAIGGSWLAPADDITASRWDLISRRTRQARLLLTPPADAAGSLLTSPPNPSTL